MLVIDYLFINFKGDFYVIIGLEDFYDVRVRFEIVK